EGTVIRAITGADATVVGHDIQSFFAVNRGVDRTNGFARRIFAVLTHHWLVHHLRIFRRLALVLIETMLASEITIDPHPMHGPAMGDLQFANDRHVVFGLASDDARAAASTNIQIDRHAPLLGPS